MCMNFNVLNFGLLNFQSDSLIWRTPWFEKLVSNAATLHCIGIYRIFTKNKVQNKTPKQKSIENKTLKKTNPNIANKLN